MERVEVHPGIADVWEELARGGPLYASVPWLRAHPSKLGPEPMSFVLSVDDRPLLGAFAARVADGATSETFDVHALLFSDPPIYPHDVPGFDPAAAAPGAPPRERWFPNLVVTLPGYETSVVGPGRSSREAVGSLVDAVVAQAEGSGCRVVAFEYVASSHPRDAALAAELERRSFVRRPLTGRAVLDVDFATFDDYLGRLGRRRRKHVRQELRALRGRGITTVETPLAGRVDEAVALRCKLLARYGHPADPDAQRASIDRIAAQFGHDALTTFVAEVEGRVVGVSVFIRFGDEWHVYWTGTDYDDPRSSLVYFETLFYAPVRAAAAHGIRRVDYGISHLDGKLGRGCEPVWLDMWVRGLDADCDDVLTRL